MNPISFEVKHTINALPTATVTYPAELCCSLQPGTLVILPCDDCGGSSWRVQGIEFAQSDGRNVAQLELAAAAEDMRRCAVSSEALFENLTVQDVLNNLVTYVQQEIGLTIAISYVNLSTFDFTSKFNPQSKNVIEILREVAGLTGNSFRFDGLTIEFGTFGNASGYVFRGGYAQAGSSRQKFFKNMTYRIDASEVIGCLYAEGGTMSAPGDQTSILKLGSVDPAWLSTPPAGYTLTQVTRFSQIEFRLCKTGGNGLSTRINVPGITPDVESGVIPSAAQQQAAGQALMEAAVEYLRVHAAPIVTFEFDVPGCLCGLEVGDTAIMLATCNGETPIYADPLYVTELTVAFEDNRTLTHVVLSSRLDDTDNSLDRTFGKGISDRVQPPITRGTGREVKATILPGVICDGVNSSSAVIAYGTTYASPPLIQSSADQGIVELSNITTTDVVVCVKTDPNPFPVLGVGVTLVVSGVSA